MILSNVRWKNGNVTKEIKMLKRGVSPYIECSSRGDKRFSPFFAYIKGSSSSIEELYQAAKKFSDGTTGLNWKQAKGKECINKDEVEKLYTELWEQYLVENPKLCHIIINASGLSDMFGKEGGVCQADVLWKIRERVLEGM